MTVSAASLASLSFVIQPSGNETLGSKFIMQPVVIALDSYANPVQVLISLLPFNDSSCTEAGLGVISSSTRYSNISGYASFSYISYNRAQTIYIKASNGM